MSEAFNLSEYMSKGIENIVKDVLKSSIKNPKEAAFIIKYMLALKNAKDKRDILEGKGEHIPPFLMASIASNCNFYCEGCYAMNNKYCEDISKGDEISAENWGAIFNEAKELGISFALLLRGEPLMRKKVIEKASNIKEIIFPIFINESMLDEDYIKLFDKNRNLVPIISIEGDTEQMDERRESGTYNLIMTAMDKLNKKGVLYGGCVTVTTKNIMTVTSKEFVQELYNKGARVLIYVEYVTVTSDIKNLKTTDKERLILTKKIEELRNLFENVILLYFPGDEKYLEGCLEAGKEFFHINAMGGAEPCPFSFYLDVNLKEYSLREALKSPIFKKLRSNEMLVGTHHSRCLLFEKGDLVKGLLGL